jgi:elongation factor G
MTLEIGAPDHCIGDISGDLRRRRGEVQSLVLGPLGKSMRAHAPLAELFGYATSLRSLSQGRATFSMEFHRYAPVPIVEPARQANGR